MGVIYFLIFILGIAVFLGVFGIGLKSIFEYGKKVKKYEDAQKDLPKDENEEPQP